MHRFIFSTTQIVPYTTQVLGNPKKAPILRRITQQCCYWYRRRRSRWLVPPASGARAPRRLHRATVFHCYVLATNRYGDIYGEIEKWNGSRVTFCNHVTPCVGFDKLMYVRTVRLRVWTKAYLPALFISRQVCLFRYLTLCKSGVFSEF